MSVFVAILGLAFLILVHEAGHFFAARSRSGCGRGASTSASRRRSSKTTRNGIEYGVGAIPLGGYVKIPGMHRPAPARRRRALRPRAAARRPSWSARSSASSARSRSRTTTRCRRSAARRARAARRRPPAERLRARPPGDRATASSPQAYWRQRTWKRVAVIVAGPATNLVLAVVLFAAPVLRRRRQGDDRPSTRCCPGQPAAAARAAPGRPDRSTIDGVPVDPTRHRHAHLRLERQARDADRRARRPNRHARPGPSAEDRAAPTGSASSSAARSSASATSVWQSLRLTGDRHEGDRQVARPASSTARGARTSPARSGSADARPRREQGAESYLWVLGLISLSLALMNLLPLLPLDGGHIAFSIVEGIRGRAVAPRGLRAGLRGRHRARPLPVRHRALERRRPIGCGG